MKGHRERVRHTMSHKHTETHRRKRADTHTQMDKQAYKR